MAVDPIIKQKADDIRHKIYGKEVRESLASGLEGMSEDVVEVTDRQATVEEQFQSVLDETTGKDVISAPEIILARNGEANLKARLDKDHQQVTAQLAQKAKHIKNVDERRFNSESVVKHRKRKPMITILDDDTRTELFTKLHPIMVQYGLPYVSAVVTGRIGRNSMTITKEQYDEINNSGLVEFISHTHNHINLTTVSLDAAEKEITDAKDWLSENGGNPDYFVTPYGQINNDTLALMRKHHKGAFRTTYTSYLAKPPLPTFDIARSDFDMRVDTQKERIDNAVLDNAWIIINTHSAYPSFLESDLREVIDYALLNDLEFVTISEGMKAFGNLIDIGDEGSSEYGGIDADGKAFGSMVENTPIREYLTTEEVTIPANSNVASVVTPTNITIINSNTYNLTPVTNLQGVVYTWSLGTSGRIVFRFNNLTDSEKTFTFGFNFTEV